MDDDVTRDLVYNQKCQIIGHKIIDGESIHAAFALGDARPDGEINDRGDQPIKQVHDEVGAVLPLFSPVDLPESLEDFEHKLALLIKCLFDDVFNGWVGDGDIMDW